MRAQHDDELIDLRSVVVEHHAAIFRYARTMTRSDADAEDLAQNAVVRALQRGPLSCGADQAKWYVLRIVRNLAIDEARTRARRRVEPFPTLPEAEIVRPVEDAVLDADEAAVRRAAFADLAARHREVLELRVLAQLGYDEVADRLDTTEHAARQRVYRATQALRAIVRARLRTT